MIVWLASYPRSGNTFFRIVLSRVFGINTYSVYNDRIFEERPTLGRMVGHVHSRHSLAELAASTCLNLVKTHELPGADTYPAIYLVRDGRDTLVSYAHFIRDFESTPDTTPPDVDETLRNLIVHRGSFGGWGPHVLTWTTRQPRVEIVKFEELIEDPARVVARALEAVSPPPASTVLPRAVPSFEELHELLPEFFRTGQVGGWREAMSYDSEALFWRNYGQAMLASGYARSQQAFERVA